LTIVGAGGLSSGDLIAFLLYGVIVAVSFAFIASTWAEMMQTAGAAERVFEIIDLNPTTPFAVAAPPRLADWRGDVEFSSVSFAYPTRPGITVLQNVSFELRPGESTALVGPSGAGKSTIVSLLLGFYRPSEGEIKCSQHPMTTLSLEELRRHIAIVPQEPQLFATTIGENLRYGKETATEAELMEACAQANILEFIESLPARFDTPVGERGVQLSAGQKQRIVIARAMLKNPTLLILDEATSALDSENEYLVQKALSSLLENRTALIIVMEHGRVVQQGTHESLSRGPGLYNQLVSRQELTS
jgi:ATP-binding cassette subfamily B protein